jgi:hypothetical protein
MGTAARAAQDFPGYFGFQGRYLVVLSDADMVASAYMDGRLGPREAGLRDTLSVIPLTAGAAGLRPVEVPVSNPSRPGRQISRSRVMAASLSLQR